MCLENPFRALEVDSLVNTRQTRERHLLAIQNEIRLITQAIIEKEANIIFGKDYMLNDMKIQLTQYSFGFINYKWYLKDGFLSEKESRLKDDELKKLILIV